MRRIQKGHKERTKMRMRKKEEKKVNNSKVVSPTAGTISNQADPSQTTDKPTVISIR